MPISSSPTPDLPSEEPERWAVPGVWDDEPDAREPEPLVVGELVQHVEDLLDQLAAAVPSDLPRGQAMGEAAALQRIAQKVRVLQLPRLADVRSRELHDLTGHRSITAWLQDHHPDAPESDAALAWGLQRLPHLNDSVHAGTVSLAAAELVRKSVTKLARHVDRPDGLVDGQPAEPVVDALLDNVVTLVARQYMGLEDDDPRLRELQLRLERVKLSGLRGASQAERVEQGCAILAEHLPLNVLPAALKELVYAVLPNTLEDEHDRAEQRRAFRLDRKPSGGYRVHADLTQEAGEALQTILAAEAVRDTSNPADTEAWRHVREEAERTGEDLGEVIARRVLAEQAVKDEHRPTWDQEAVIPLVEEVALERSDGSLVRPRSRSERLHDAFANMLLRYLGSGLGGEHGKVPVQMNVTLSADLMANKPGALPATGASGQPLARSMLRRMWCDAHVTVLLMTLGWKPLGVVHSGRTLTGLERKASLVQSDRRCAGVGCCPGLPDPLTPLVPHHLILYALNGATTMEETLWACPGLHHDLHTGQRTVQLRDGRWVNENGVVSNPYDQPDVWDQAS